MRWYVLVFGLTLDSNPSSVVTLIIQGVRRTDAAKKCLASISREKPAKAGSPRFVKVRQ
jgi:hypothetical protein